MGGCFGGRRPVGKLRDSWDDAIGRDAVHLLQIWNQKAATRSRGWLEVEGQGDHDPKTGQSVIVEGEVRQKIVVYNSVFWFCSVLILHSCCD